jgi:pimeloyl-ACP methyl ester carboxylesterase
MTTWLLLRGWTREAHHWGRFPAQLRHLVAAEPVLALDLPGAGARHREPCPLSVEAIARACRADAIARGARPPFVLVALSLGAMAAIAWAARHPDELAGAVLINTSVRGVVPWRLRLRGGWRVPAVLLARDDAARERAVLALTTQHPSEPADLLVAQWVRWRRERPPSWGNAARQLFAAARAQAPSATPRVPLLVLASARDRLVDPACSTRLAARWALEPHLHPTAGHDLPLDAPAWVLERIAAWRAQLAR